MANVHGQVARHGITIQTESRFSPAVGWLSDFTRQSGGTVPSWVGTTLTNGGISIPRWMSDVPERRRVLSYEKHRGYSRYPGRRNITINESLDVNLQGMSTRFSVDASIGGVRRASHKGLDQGARRGNMTIRIRAWNTNGQLVVDDNRLSSGQFPHPHISGWSPRNLYRWEQEYTSTSPIGRVLVEQNITTGSENFHDVGDRSPGGSWNPTENIGRYYPFNYYSILGANEQGSVNRVREFIL
jgi:hypothetical protein